MDCFWIFNRFFLRLALAGYLRQFYLVREIIYPPSTVSGAVVAATGPVGQGRT
jgi:hypothetical protein